MAFRFAMKNQGFAGGDIYGYQVSISRIEATWLGLVGSLGSCVYNNTKKMIWHIPFDL